MIHDIGHIRFTLLEAGEGLISFSLTAPGGDKPEKKLFTGFVNREMAMQLRALADAVDNEVTV